MVHVEMVLMALSTTFMTTPVLHWIYPSGAKAMEAKAPPPA